MVYTPKSEGLNRPPAPGYTNRTAALEASGFGETCGGTAEAPHASGAHPSRRSRDLLP